MDRLMAGEGLIFLYVSKCIQIETGDLAEVCAPVLRHAVAVGAIAKSATEALQAAVRGREVEHLDVSKAFRLKRATLPKYAPLYSGTT